MSDDVGGAVMQDNATKRLQNAAISIYAYVSTAASNSLMGNRDISKNKTAQRSQWTKAHQQLLVSSYILGVKGIFSKCG